MFQSCHIFNSKSYPSLKKHQAQFFSRYHGILFIFIYYYCTTKCQLQSLHATHTQYIQYIQIITFGIIDLSFSSICTPISDVTAGILHELSLILNSSLPTLNRDLGLQNIPVSPLLVDTIYAEVKTVEINSCTFHTLFPMF